MSTKIVLAMGLTIAALTAAGLPSWGRAAQPAPPASPLAPKSFVLFQSLSETLLPIGSYNSVTSQYAKGLRKASPSCNAGHGAVGRDGNPGQARRDQFLFLLSAGECPWHQDRCVERGREIQGGGGRLTGMARIGSRLGSSAA